MATKAIKMVNLSQNPVHVNLTESLCIRACRSVPIRPKSELR